MTTTTPETTETTEGTTGEQDPCTAGYALVEFDADGYPLGSVEGWNCKNPGTERVTASCPSCNVKVGMLYCTDHALGGITRQVLCNYCLGPVTVQ